MNFVIVHTESGSRYASVIARSLRWISDKKRKPIRTHVVSVNDLSAFFETHTELNSTNTLIHSRAAHPTETGWMRTLFNLEERGFNIVNSSSALRLTSDKLTCSLKLQGTIPHPKTWKILNGVFPDNLTPGSYVIKPVTSMEQGARVRTLFFDGNFWSVDPPIPQVEQSQTGVRDAIRSLGNLFVLQEFVPYTALYRVIVIDGHALPYAFVDKLVYHPGNWKVSVCLNKTSMQFVAHPDEKLLHLAEAAQNCVKAKISFVDIFETTPGEYTMSEINTACNLTIHERLAKASLGDRGAWNIHYRIAKCLWESANL